MDKEICKLHLIKNAKHFAVILHLTKNAKHFAVILHLTKNAKHFAVRQGFS